MRLQAGTNKSLASLMLIGVALAIAVSSALLEPRLRPVALIPFGIGVFLRIPMRMIGSYLIPCVAYVGLWAIFGFLRGFADEVPWADSTLHWVPRFEIWLFGELPSATLQDHWLTPDNRRLHDFLLMLVYYSFFFLPLLCAALMIVRNRVAFWFNFWTLVMMEGSALLLHFALPTAPPWLADSSIYKVTKIGRMVTDAASSDPSGSLAKVDTNQFAAMPSVHMGITCALAVTAWKFGGRGYRLASVLYCGAMALCLVYFGEHYVVDEVVGVLLTVGAGVVAGWLMTSQFGVSLKPTVLRVARRSSPQRPVLSPGMMAHESEPAD